MSNVISNNFCLKTNPQNPLFLNLKSLETSRLIFLNPETKVLGNQMWHHAVRYLGFNGFDFESLFGMFWKDGISIKKKQSDVSITLMVKTNVTARAAIYF